MESEREKQRAHSLVPPIAGIAEYVNVKGKRRGCRTLASTEGGRTGEATGSLGEATGSSHAESDASSPPRPLGIKLSAVALSMSRTDSMARSLAPLVAGCLGMANLVSTSVRQGGAAEAHSFKDAAAATCGGDELWSEPAMRTRAYSSLSRTMYFHCRSSSVAESYDMRSWRKMARPTDGGGQYHTATQETESTKRSPGLTANCCLTDLL
jgi:hypothetical protein